MKKVVAVVLSMVLVMSMGMPVMASNITTAPSSSTSISDYTEIEQNIPVYGYVGPDAMVTDSNTSDPGTAPTFSSSSFQLTLTVPVKFIWAAMAEHPSAAVNILSPSYTITNSAGNSNPVLVTMKSVVAGYSSSTSADNATLDATNGFSLMMNPVSSSFSAAIPLVTGGATPYSTDEALDGTNVLATGSSYAFTLGGSVPNTAFPAASPNTLKPLYTICFEFALDD